MKSWDHTPPWSDPPRLRIGCCGSMIAPAADPVGIEIVEDLAALGYDYIELSLRDLLCRLGPVAECHGITIAIEHLNRQESNILNSVAECWRLAREVAHPRVRLLIDAYHLLVEGEPLPILPEVGPAIAHVHVAQGAGRVFPGTHDAPLAVFVAQLRAAGYARRCSIEAHTRDFSADAPRALRQMRSLDS